ncbi:MAG: molybdopterin molybdotransferase MoeA [Polyangiaceae bacterium]|jgi:molybdopterin molybdotransferase|nr:molybdopterin molybdotransferase MoeA [Polyangiaceae bacterium]
MEHMISPDRALELVLAHVPPTAIETVSLDSSLGRVLAERIVAPEDCPPFIRAMMDGFAVRAQDAGRSVRVCGEAAAGQATAPRVEPGGCVEIMTGAPCPEGTEAVVTVEQTQRVGDHVKLPPNIRKGQHVQPVGALCARATQTLAPGDRVTPLVLANLAAFNRERVQVVRMPRVAVISTGNELVRVGEPLQPGAIRDSNGPMLVAMTRELGVEPVQQHHARDTDEALRETLNRTASAEVVVFTGGVSMGKYDLVPRAVEAMGATMVFHKVTQKPGKPLLFAVGQGRLVFGLPGNARSSHFTFHRYVAAALRKWIGLAPAPAGGTGVLVAPMSAQSSRTLFLPVRVDRGAPAGNWLIAPLGDRGSADIYGPVRANAYVRFEPGEHHVAQGEQREFAWMGEHHG